MKVICFLVPLYDSVCDVWDVDTGKALAGNVKLEYERPTSGASTPMKATRTRASLRRYSGKVSMKLVRKLRNAIDT
jgi:hypothetical protein